MGKGVVLKDKAKAQGRSVRNKNISKKDSDR